MFRDAKQSKVDCSGHLSILWCSAFEISGYTCGIHNLMSIGGKDQIPAFPQSCWGRTQAHGLSTQRRNKARETGAIRTPCGSSCPLSGSEKELGKVLVFVALERQAAESVRNGVFPGPVLTPEFLAELQPGCLVLLVILWVTQKY